MKTLHELSVECQGKQLVRILVTQKEGHRRKRMVKTWTTQEDNRLLGLYEQNPKKWSIISNLMVDRNQNQCLHRFRRLSQLDHHQKIWSDEEDEMVRKLIKKFGKNWKVLAEAIGSKTGKQIRERYINKLDPKIRKDDWTEEEDLQLISLFTSIGSHWSEIAKKLPGRPQNRIKNRFYSYIRRTYNIKEVSLKHEDDPETHVTNVTLPQPAHKSVSQERLESCLNFSILHEMLHAPEESKGLIESSSFFLGDNKSFAKAEIVGLTSLLHLPEEDFMVFLDSGREL